MKVIETHEIGKDFEYCGKGSIDVVVKDDNDKLLGSAEIIAGEPEDAVFYRDLGGAYSIVKLMRIAYEAGKNGESFNYEFVDYSEEEDD